MRSQTVRNAKSAEVAEHEFAMPRVGRIKAIVTFTAPTLRVFCVDSRRLSLSILHNAINKIINNTKEKNSRQKRKNNNGSE